MAGKKTALLAFALLFSVSLASANSLGSFSSETSKTIEDRHAEYSIGVFNMGQKPLDVTITSEITGGNEEDIRLQHPEEMTLEPSEPTANPSGDGPWFLAGDKYVRVTKIPVHAFVDDDRSTDSFSFKVTVEAISSNANLSNSDASATQKISQVRSYRYDLGIGEKPQEDETTQGDNREDLSTINNRTGVPGQGFLDRARGVLGTSFNQLSDSSPTQTQEPEIDQEPSKGDDEEDNQETGSRTSERKQGTQTDTGSAANNVTGQFFSGVNSTSYVLMLMMLLSTFYLLRVMEVV